MPKANIPSRPGSIMSYFEPVKLPKKLAKLEQADQAGETSSTDNKQSSDGTKNKKQLVQKSAASTTTNIAHLEWTLQGTLLKTRFEPVKRSLPKYVAVAAFDLDSTLVDTKSPTPFPRNGSDWKWLTSNTKQTLKSLAKFNTEGASSHEVEETSNFVRKLKSTCPHIVVVFSNQGGVVAKPDAKRFQYIKERIAQIAYDLDSPFWFYAATKEPKDAPPNTVSYRKPAIGMWLQFKKEIEESGMELDLESSFFVGDAAGRPIDFSDSDLKFAQAIGLQFYTPEEFF